MARRAYAGCNVFKLRECILVVGHPSVEVIPLEDYFDGTIDTHIMSAEESPGKFHEPWQIVTEDD